MTSRRWPLDTLTTIIVCTVVTTSLPGQAATGQHDDTAHTRALLARGENPFPIKLKLSPPAPLSAMAEIGRKIFYDPSFSGSGKVSCAFCHDPAHHYGPIGKAAVAVAGKTMTDHGVRAVPSLMYLAHQPPFSVGPDNEENESTTLAQRITAASSAKRAVKTAGSGASAVNIVPQGGLFWDGRSDTLQDQAAIPLFNPIEMAAKDVATVAARLRQAPYAKAFVRLFGPEVLKQPHLLLSEAMFAVARYQLEDASFHPYTSKFDAWLEGRTRLSPAEMRGYVLFNDPKKANCGGCHLDQPGVDGTPPLFTDHQYEALSPPRNTALKANADPSHYDLGICGPYRTNMQKQTQFCGMFLTPTLRDVATRKVFFHNGVFKTLRQVLDFYAFRVVKPEKVYPRGPDGVVDRDNDIPKRYRINIDVTDPPFDRHLGQAPAITPKEEKDIIAFLGTLTDGYKGPMKRN